MRHSTPTRPGAATDQDARSLLVRHQCPTPFPVVRSLFMGAIASPRLDVSPLGALARIWGGEMPEFASQEEVEDVVGILVQGLWNRLADHQPLRNPFRLTRFDVTPTRQALHDLAWLRTQELEGFVDGLFGPEHEMMLPEKAHDAVQALAELHAMFADTAKFLADEEKPAQPQDLKTLLHTLQQMAILADERINKAVQACKRWRLQQLKAMGTEPSRSTLSFGRRNPGASGVPGHEDDQGQEQENQGDAHDPEPEIVVSALSQSVTRHGVSVEGDGHAAGHF